MSEIFGIDFGTTNSAIVGISHGRPTLYGDGAGQPFPSIVAIDKMTGDVVAIGRNVWSYRDDLRESCEIITSAKMHLGTKKSWPIGPRNWTPEKIVTEIFFSIKEEISKRTRGNSTLENAVVAIPVGFSSKKRSALRSAATAAGITIKGFISEPTAALYKNYENIKKWQKIAVFDWGGGTLDISIVELRGGTVDEIATSGEPLGGDWIDQKIAEWAHDQIVENKKNSQSFEEMPQKYQDALIVRSEEAKRLLSDQEEAVIILHQYGSFENVNVKINRDILKSLLAPEMDRALDLLKKAIIKKAHMSFEELGCILMVGGSSKLHGFFDRMRECEFTCEIIPPYADSDWHTAHGSALLNIDSGEYITSQNIGLELSDGTYFPLIKDGDSVDYKIRSFNFGLIEDSDNARLIFIENGNGSAEINRSRTIGYLTLPTYGFVREPIKVTALIDEDLLFRIKARSEHRALQNEQSWEYPELRFSYKLPK